MEASQDKTKHGGLHNVLLVCYNTGQEQKQHSELNTQELVDSHIKKVDTQDMCLLDVLS